MLPHPRLKSEPDPLQCVCAFTRPVMAGFINQNTSWRWTYYLVIIWSSVQLLLLIVLLPETHHPTVLKSKAHHVRQSTGDDRWTTTHERSKMHMGEAIKKSCQTPFVLMATEPMVLLLNVWTAVLLAILYLDFNAIPIVFRQHHGFNQQMSGLCFLGLGVGILSTFFFQPLWKSSVFLLLTSIFSLYVLNLTSLSFLGAHSDSSSETQPPLTGSFSRKPICVKACLALSSVPSPSSSLRPRRSRGFTGSYLSS